MKETVINNMLIIHDIVILIIAFGLHWLVAYFTKKGSNNADKEDMHDISFIRVKKEVILQMRRTKLAKHKKND